MALHVKRTFIHFDVVPPMPMVSSPVFGQSKTWSAVESTINPMAVSGIVVEQKFFGEADLWTSEGDLLSDDVESLAHRSDFYFDATPSPQFTHVYLHGVEAAKTARATRRRRRQGQPFSALNMPQWALMTAGELDELSDSDVSDDETDIEISSDEMLESFGESASIIVDAWKQDMVSCRLDSCAASLVEVSDSDVETTCCSSTGALAVRWPDTDSDTE